MEIISTQFDIDINYDSIYKEVFESCYNDSACSSQVPSQTTLINEMALQFFEDEELTSDEQYEKANLFMANAIDGSNAAFYREVF